MRFLGVVSASAALVLGVAGDAMACSIKDFSAVAECEGDRGVIRVTDVDPLGVTAEVSVFRKNGADEELVGTQTIEDSTAAGVTVTFEEDWQPKAKYRVHIYAATYVNADLPMLTAPADACQTTDDPPPAEETPETPENPEPSDEPSESTDDTPTPNPTPTPSASESTPPADTTDDNAPSPEGAPQPQGQSNLAETGASSNTGVIAGIAAALVAVGGGAIFYGMRRRGASSR
ncbi:LAETG motif-containing sortase-dependent surface protein [Streptomyces sp. NPDC002845]